ncbi:MAG: class 1 fructose-bisphosphatase [Planctomycetota bacterium]
MKVPLEDPNGGLMSVQTWLLDEESRHPGATGRLTWILSAITLASKYIAARCRRARLEDVLGSLECENVQGEVQQKLDVIANETLLRCLGNRAGLAIVASEENEEPIILRTSNDPERPYIALFDPLDGSSNIDTCGGVGTIFSILAHDRRAKPMENAVLQPGLRQVAAGYVLYGPSTILVMTTGNGVQMFVLDPSIGSFLMVEPNLRIPKAGKVYSINEAYAETFPTGYQNYLAWAHKEGYSSRYAGAMVADVHRVLIRGGVFLYPPTKKAPKGKLRLMYEANPMAMLVEQAGGKAYSGLERTLEIQPADVHDRVSVIIGSPDEVDHVMKHLS